MYIGLFVRGIRDLLRKLQLYIGIPAGNSAYDVENLVKQSNNWTTVQKAVAMQKLGHQFSACDNLVPRVLSSLPASPNKSLGTRLYIYDNHPVNWDYSFNITYVFRPFSISQ